MQVFFLMIRRPPRSTLDRSSAASDVYKRQGPDHGLDLPNLGLQSVLCYKDVLRDPFGPGNVCPVSYTHLRAHETVLDLVCRLLLEKKNYRTPTIAIRP